MANEDIQQMLTNAHRSGTGRDVWSANARQSIGDAHWFRVFRWLHRAFVLSLDGLLFIRYEKRESKTNVSE